MPLPASPDDFASELKRVRVVSGLSQADLGGRAGLTGSYVCMLELRRKPAPTEDVVRALACALAIDDARLQQRAALERTPEPVRRRVLRLAKDRLRTRRRRDRLLTTTIFHMTRRPDFLPDHVAEALGLPDDRRAIFGRLAERVRRVPSAIDAEKRARDLLSDVSGREREALVAALPRLLGSSPAAEPIPRPAERPDGVDAVRTWRRVLVLATPPSEGSSPRSADAIDLFHVDRRLWRPGAYVLVADDDDAWPRVEKGDWLLLDVRAIPADGDLVVVRHDGRVRIRILRRQGSDARLDAARSDVPPVRVPESRLSLAGVVRWIFRPLEGPPPPRRREPSGDDVPGAS